MTSAERRQLLALLLAAAIVLGAGLGLRDPWPPDEPRFALIAKEMVASGEWLIPRIGGVLYPDKPPLFFWLVAAFHALTGSISVALLLPAFFSGLGILWLVHDLARRLWNPRAALWSAAALLAMVQFPLQMKAGQIDALLCFWATLGLYGLCRHLLLGPDWRWFAVAGFACGLGVITKGVGFLPFLALIPWLAARRFGCSLSVIDWSHGKWLLAPAAFAVAVGLWLVPMLVATTGAADPDLAAYRDNILLKQTLTRYAEPWGHVKSPWYLFTHAIPWLWLPLTFLLPWLVPAWTRDLKARSSATLVLGGWVLLVLLFFSISDGKRSLYILPALPALALLTGPHLPSILERAGPRRVLLGLATLPAALLAAAGLYALGEPSVSSQWTGSTPGAIVLAALLIGLGVVALGVAAVLRVRHAIAAFAAVFMILWVAAPLLLYPRIDDFRSGRAIVEAAAAALEPGQTLGFAGWKAQFLLQWNRPAVHFGYRREDWDSERREAAAWVASAPEYRLLLPQAMLDPCFVEAGVTALGFAHRQRWFLASARAVVPACRHEPGAGNLVRYDPSGATGKAAAELRTATRRP
jgi:4-amino-4-deoxy-L-arabinose transferase-like glycosyltransferase